jgi:hypothetical protein
MNISKIKLSISKHKLLFVILMIGGLLLLDFVSYKINPHNSIAVRIVKKYYLAKTTDKAKDFYRTYAEPLQTDEYIMLLWLWPEYAPSVNRVFINDPLFRIYKDKYRTNDINLSRLANSKKELQTFIKLFGINRNIYKVNDKYENTLTDEVDDILFKALYCDVSGYDEFDYNLLSSIADNQGGYGDTHYLLSLLFLEKLKCIETERIVVDKTKVINSIVEAQKKDEGFSDLFAERVVMLYWAGMGEKVELLWIMRIAKNIQSDGGWMDENMSVSDPHATGLSALAIRYFVINKSIDKLIAK